MEREIEPILPQKCLIDIHDYKLLCSDPIILLLIHATTNRQYLTTAKRLMAGAYIDKAELIQLARKDVLGSTIEYIIRSSGRIPDTHKRNLAHFLKNELNLDISINPFSIDYDVNDFYYLDLTARMVNKAFNNATISEPELKQLLMQVFPTAKFDSEEAKALKARSWDMLTLSLIFFADEKNFADFFGNIQHRLKNCPPHTSLWIYTRRFKDLYNQKQFQECEKLIDQMQNFTDITRSLDKRSASTFLSIFTASDTLYDYYIFRSEPKIAFEEYIKNIYLLGEEGGYLATLRPMYDIFKFKKPEVRRFWLDKLVQEWPISSETKIKLSKWLYDGTKLSFSKDISLLEQHKEQKLDIENETSSKSLKSSINLISLYNELLFHANNLNINESINLLTEINSYGIPESSKEQITLQALHSLSFQPNDTIAQIVDEMNLPEFGTDSYIATSQIYLNLFDYFPQKEEYWQKSLEYRDKAKQLSLQGISNTRIEKKLEHLELEISAKAASLIPESQKHIDQSEESSSTSHVIDDSTKYLDPREEHRGYQELKQQARENAIAENREEPEVVYSWKIGDHIYKSTDPHVILIDPDQLIFGINDVSGTEQELAPFDEALRKGFIPPNKQGKGLKYLSGLGIIEAKTNEDKRTVCDTIFFNPEGAKLIIMTDKLKHKGVKRQDKEFNFDPCASETCSTLLNKSECKIDFQVLYGLRGSNLPLRPGAASRFISGELGGGRSL